MIVLIENACDTSYDMSINEQQEIRRHIGGLKHHRLLAGNSTHVSS
jgi:hypothetical protein